jgi:hypothetical protein
MASPSAPDPTAERRRVLAEGVGVDQHGNPEPGTARQLRTLEGVEAAADEPDRTTEPELPVGESEEEQAEEPWLTRRQRRALQRVFSQALDRQAGTVRRQRWKRPAGYTGQVEPVKVARARRARAQQQQQEEKSVDA